MEKIDRNMRGEPLVITVRGAPAVGKTTVTKALQSAILASGETCARIAWDDFFHMVEHANISDHDITVTTQAMVLAAGCLVKRHVRVVILDGVFVLPEEWEAIKTLNAARHILVRLTCNADLQMVRNCTRAPEDRLPQERLREVADMQEWSVDPKDDLVIDTGKYDLQKIVEKILGVLHS